VAGDPTTQEEVRVPAGVEVTSGASPPAPPPEPARPLTTLRWKPWQVAVFIAYVATVLVASPIVAGLLGRLPEQWRHVAAASVITAFYGLILTPVWVSARRQGVSFGEAIGVRATPAWPAIAGGVLTAVAYWWFAISWVLVLMAAHIKLPARAVYVTRLFGPGPLGFVLSVAVVAVIAPLAEESVFRGVMYAQLRDAWGAVPAGLASAVVFAAAHANALGFLPLAFIAGVSAWLFTRSRSLWSAIAVHSCVNFSLVVLQYATGAGLK
jgi:membrane protease YdiL (CAAX protease family)